MFAQFLFDQSLKISLDSPFGRLVYKLLVKGRSGLRHLGDPLVKYELDGMDMLLPVSHRLPEYRKIYPKYSENVGRIANVVHQKYPDMTFIDIGANIGDTVFILRARSHFPILCIEGDRRFINILTRNVTKFDDVKIVECFIGETKTSKRVVKIYHEGSLRLRSDRVEGEEVEFETLSSVLKNEPSFLFPRMIKVDTDGYDCRILKSEINLLSQTRPVLFFEYDPNYFEYPAEGLELLERLSEVGYQTALVYENSGDFFVAVDLSDSLLLKDINHYFAGWGGNRYCDICLFHLQDEDISRQLHEEELLMWAPRISL